jgi:hypothetical protein
MKRGHRLSIILVSVLLISLAPWAFAQGGGERAIETLAASSKIIESDLVLEDFLAGSETTRVIVTLIEPSGFQQTANLQRGLELTNSQLSHEGGDINDPAFRSDLQAAVQAAQDRVINLLDPNKVQINRRFVYIFGFAAEVTLEGLKELEALDAVAFINKDRILKAHLAQGIPLMNATTVRSTYDGSGMSIAICDTGIDTSHPMLGGGGSPIFNAKVIGGYDTGDDDADPRPHPTLGSAHGTACAGISAGDLGTVGDYIGGLAHNAKLYAVKISTGDSGSASEAAMIAGWEWPVTHQNDDPDNPIMIISTSFGGGYYTSTCDTASPSMTAAAANAVAAGITVFASSGNDAFTNGMGWPACISHVNSVGAVYDADVGYHGYSNCTDTTTAPDQVTCYSNSASFLTLFAPSHDAYTTDIVGAGGYEPGDYDFSFGGTSAACPYAAGAAALLQSAAKAMTDSFLTPAEVRTLLTSTGDPITDPKAPTVTKPRINLQAAVDAIGAPPGDVLLQEDFESWPPAGWTIVNNGGDCEWQSSATTGRTNYAGGDGFCADADSDLCGMETTMDTELVTPPLDFSGLTAAALTYTSAYRDISDGSGDYADVDISTDGGTTWTNLLHWDEDHDDVGPGEVVNIDLSSYVGSANVIIRFHYVAPGWDWYWEVDHVVITGVGAEMGGTWDQPISAANTAVYANQDFEAAYDIYDIFLADDFTNTAPWTINTIYVHGNTWNVGCDLTCATNLHFMIYADSSGVPAGDPSGGGDAPLWTLSVPPGDSQVTLSAGIDGFQTNVTLSPDTPIQLPAGTYWLVFYPELSYTDCICQYGRHVSDTTNGNIAKVINPAGGFGLPTVWTDITDPSTWGLPQQDLAFRIEYTTEAAAILGADFGASGLYTYDQTAWDRINSNNPSGLGAYGNKLVANFPSMGLYEYDGTDWQRINTNDGAQNMVAVDSILYVDFGATGLYRFDGSSWSRIVRMDASVLASFDGKLAVNFPGRGLYAYDGGWSRITRNDTAETMIGVGSLLYVEFSNGLWEYNGTSFRRLTRWEVSSLATYDGKLAVNFPGHGLYEYDGSWSRINKNDTAQGMCGVGSVLYVDFGAAGLYRYDGSFQRVSTNNCEDMVSAVLP